MSKLIIATVLAASALTGCQDGYLVWSDEKRQEIVQLVNSRGEARIALFTKCMELAATMPREMDDDVSDIVGKCQQASYYMTNYME